MSGIALCRLPCLLQFNLFGGRILFPIRIVHFLIHTWLALLIFSALRYWKVAVGPALLASLYFVISQASVYPIIANDMVSQMMGSLFAVLTLWVLYGAGGKTDNPSRVPLRQIVLALCFFALSLFSKETSTRICLGVFALSPRHGTRRHPPLLVSACSMLRSFPCHSELLGIYILSCGLTHPP